MDDDIEALKANGGFGRQNIYIRSTAYVERLSDEDLSLLTSSIAGDMLGLSEELSEMIGRTYRSVIEVHTEDYEGDYTVLYDDALSGRSLASNTALVLAIAYEPSFDENGMLLDAEVEDEKDEMVETLRALMLSELGESLGDVAIFIL